MSEHAVADFVGRFALDPSTGDDEPRSGRIVMSERRLVVAHDDGQVTVPFSDVLDVVVGTVPDGLKDLFDDTVTIAYDDGTSVRTVVIEGDADTISKFRTVLYKCLLDGTAATVRHPADVGGRVLETAPQHATVSVGGDRVAFDTPDGRVDLDVSAVVDFEWRVTASDDADRRGFAVAYDDDGSVVTAVVSMDAPRDLNLLGRYVRREYSRQRADVAELDLDATEIRALVAIYATGGDVELGTVVGDDAHPDETVRSLRDDGLVADEASGLSLTESGRVAVLSRFDDAIE